jgi:hypothetical protein
MARLYWAHMGPTGATSWAHLCSVELFLWGPGAHVWGAPYGPWVGPWQWAQNSNKTSLRLSPFWLKRRNLCIYKNTFMDTAIYIASWSPAVVHSTSTRSYFDIYVGAAVLIGLTTTSYYILRRCRRSVQESAQQPFILYEGSANK